MNHLTLLDSDTILTLFFAALITGLVIFLAVSVRRSKKAGGEDVADEEIPAEDLSADPGEDDDWTPPEPEAYPARVVDMRVVVGNVGGNKRPKTGASFLVTFLTDDGERTEYSVPEDLYVTLEMDQAGTLVILNGGFFDFGSGDAYDEAAVEAFHNTFGAGE